MAIFGLFKKQKEPEDYEEVLQSIQVDIQKRQQRLQEIKLRERRTTLLITLYTFGAWVASIGAWYAGWRPAGSAPLIIGPLIIQFARRISQWWYTRSGDAEEATLKSLLAKQKNKVEEIKKKTNYYSMKNLVERYDGPQISNPSRPKTQTSQGQQQPKQMPQRPQNGPPNGTPQTPVQNRGQLGPQVPQPLPLPAIPYQRQWYDRLIDAILGEEESVNSPKNQYALICQKCYTHNGLVKEEQWQDTQFICMKCGDFNPSVRAIQTGQGMMSPPKVIAPLSQPNSAVSPTHRRAAPRKSAPLSATTSSLLDSDADEPSFLRRKSGLLEEPDREDGGKHERRTRDAIDTLLASDDEDMSVELSPSRPHTREAHMEVDSHHVQKKRRARISISDDDAESLALTQESPRVNEGAGSSTAQQQALATILSQGVAKGRTPKLYAVMEF